MNVDESRSGGHSDHTGIEGRRTLEVWSKRLANFGPKSQLSVQASRTGSSKIYVNEPINDQSGYHRYC